MSIKICSVCVRFVIDALTAYVLNEFGCGGRGGSRARVIVARVSLRQWLWRVKMSFSVALVGPAWRTNEHVEVSVVSISGKKSVSVVGSQCLQ